MSSPVSAKKKRRNAQSDQKAKLHWLYADDDVIKLYDVCRNTLINWVAAGLPFINAKQRLFRGADLNAFHRKRRAKLIGEPLGLHEAKCFGCKRHHSLLEGVIDISAAGDKGNFSVSVACRETGSRAYRWMNRQEMETLERLRQTNPGPKTPD